MPGVTISASYGAGGSVIAPLVAERLGHQLLDRAMSATVAAQLQVTVAEAERGEIRRGIIERLFGTPSGEGSGPIAIDVMGMTVPTLGPDDTPRFRERSEALMRAALAEGAVILGRAGSAAFRNTPEVLRVRLHGAPERRAEHAAALEGVDVPTAARRLADVDKSRAGYVRRLYKQDIDDPSTFHLALDSTLLPIATCVDLIVVAYAALQPDQQLPV